MPGTVLLTGGAGFIGAQLARSLLGDGYEVVVVDDLSSGRRENVPDEADLLELDLAREESVRKLPERRYDAVLHLAGQPSGEKSFDDPAADFDANARSTVLLASWAADAGVPVFLHASSMAVYGEPDSLPVPEGAHARPLSHYGASKRAAEHTLAVAGRRGMRTCSLRMFNVYGPGQDLSNLRQGMVSIYLAYLLRAQPLVVRGPLDRVRDFVYVDDVVQAWRLALERPASGPLNIAAGRPTSVGELVELLLVACGLPGDHPVEVAPGTPGDVHAIWADVSAAASALGWAAGVSLEEGLERTVAETAPMASGSA